MKKTTWKHNGDFYCLNCLYSLRTENKLKIYEKVCKTKDFCGIAMPSEKDNILKFNKYRKSDKIPCIVYADLECFIKKIDGCANNSKKSSTAKSGEPVPYGYSMSTIWGFDNIENKNSLYRGGRLYEKFYCSTESMLQI